MLLAAPAAAQETHDSVCVRLESTAHDHGPACSGIAKIVDFALAPGGYTVQLSEAKGDAVGGMVVQR